MTNKQIDECINKAISALSEMDQPYILISGNQSDHGLIRINTNVSHEVITNILVAVIESIDDSDKSREEITA